MKMARAFTPLLSNVATRIKPYAFQKGQCVPRPVKQSRLEKTNRACIFKPNMLMGLHHAADSYTLICPPCRRPCGTLHERKFKASSSEGNGLGCSGTSGRYFNCRNRYRSGVFYGLFFPYKGGRPVSHTAYRVYLHAIFENSFRPSEPTRSTLFLSASKTVLSHFQDQVRSMDRAASQTRARRSAHSDRRVVKGETLTWLQIELTV